MITKNLGHQLNYRKVFAKWTELKENIGMSLTNKERACLYLCCIDERLATYLYEHFDFNFISNKDYFTDDNALIIKVADYILNDSRNRIYLNTVIESVDGPFIIQALHIAFPILRTGRENPRNGGRKSIYSDELIDSLIKDFEQGLSFNELAEKYNMPKSSVHYHCKSSKVAK